MEQSFCQSCGMPLNGNNHLLGTNEDFSQNKDYCCYCYKNGTFTADISMEEMVEMCIPHLIEIHPEMGAEDARSMMMGFFPNLKRWQ